MAIIVLDRETLFSCLKVVVVVAYITQIYRRGFDLLAISTKVISIYEYRYIYIYICMCLSVCVCVNENNQSSIELHVARLLCLYKLRASALARRLNES